MDLMGLFDLFVLPSVHMDSSPNVLLEAMGVGLPAVASDVGGVAEILDQGAAGRVVKAGDPAALAEPSRRSSTCPTGVPGWVGADGRGCSTSSRWTER